MPALCACWLKPRLTPLNTPEPPWPQATAGAQPGPFFCANLQPAVVLLVCGLVRLYLDPHPGRHQAGPPAPATVVVLPHQAVAACRLWRRRGYLVQLCRL